MLLLGQRSLSSAVHKVLNVIWYAGIVAIVGIGLALVVLGVLMPSLLPQELPGQLKLTFPGLEVLLASPAVAPVQRSMLLYGFALTLPMLLLALVITHQLRCIFAALAQNRPFLAENARYVRRIGMVVFVWALVQSVIELLVGIFLAVNVTIPGAVLNPRWSPSPALLFMGVVLLVLAEIFRIGARMQDEQDLTV